MIAGGALNIALWPIYTSVHGPGSVDMQGEVLGMGTLFWGSMMEGPSGLLIALGLAGSYGRLTGRAGRMARVGYVLTMIGVVIPALVNLAILAVVPPLLAPVFGTGLILMAVANRRTSSLTRFSRLLLWGSGSCCSGHSSGWRRYGRTCWIRSTATGSTAPLRTCSSAWAGFCSAPASLLGVG